MEYNTSDKLAIALACLAGVMAIILFLVEKTPLTVILLLSLMLALAIYPVLHFAKHIGVRVLAFSLFVIGALLLGWHIMPHSHSISASTQEPQQPTPTPEGRKDDKKSEDTKKQEPKPKPKPKAEQPTQDNHVGSVEQGPCSNLQIGGTGNQATVNCGPPPPVFTLKLLKENVKLSESHYRTEYQLNVETKTAFPSLHVRAEGTGIGFGDFATCLEVNRVVAGGATGHLRDSISGYGFCDTHAQDVRSGQYLIEVLSVTPTKVHLTYEPD